MKRLTVGASYNANRNRSTYRNLDNSVFHQKQDKAYFFAEYYQRINNFTFTAGAGRNIPHSIFANPARAIIHGTFVHKQRSHIQSAQIIACA